MPLLFHWDPLWNNVLPSSQRERRVSRLNRTGNNTTGWARRLTALLVTACLVMAMALPVYAEVDLLPDAPDEVELLEDEPGTASGEDTVPPEQNAATPVPDAATPEPEQSAGPEQPAPTETPEPTAEPTPTPEPTATATATPVPTVTPTATPEPTEQPQKMYAEEAEDEDGALEVSERAATDGFTVYFAVNSSNTIEGKTIDDTDVIKFNGQMDSGNTWCTHPMEKTTIKTSDGRTIYALRNCTDATGNNFTTIQFQLWSGNNVWKGKIELKVSATINSYNLKMYDAEAGTWTDASTLEGHKYFAGKTIKFENRSAAALTNVKANFYIPDEGALTPVNGASEVPTVAKGGVANFIIPTEACSYVQFTWVEDGQKKSSKFYNFYNESVSDDKESFMYSETSDCFIYTGADNVRWGRENSFRIYYDATFSKLPTKNEDTGGDYSIPKDKQSTVYYRLKGENGNESINGTMSRIGSTDYYAADVPEGYTQIVFSSYPLSNDDNLAGRGDSTGWETIPDYKDKEPCFYADTNDDAVYGKGQRGNGQRGGYWAPKDTPRDAEKWKNTTIVDIADAKFTEDPNTKYVTSTLYDYYTDYELNGKNRDNYKDNDNKASHRNWVTFREFDQALSDYYSNSGTTVPYPMYTGQFQPDAVGADGREWGIRFSEIADTLNLYGYKKDKNLFMAVNNSTSDRNGKGLGQNQEKLYDETFQGLAGPELKNGEPIMNGTNLAMPFFNEEFLQGENSKKAKLGNVYKEVSFPFTQDEVFKESDATNANEKGVKYWYFDSDKTTLYLKNDPDNGGYFLQKQNALESKSKNLKSDSTPVEVKNEKGETVKNEKGEPVYTYGFFPFNSGASEKQASTYNYGFGAKLQFQFTLTSDGTVKDDNGNNIPIKFFFSGDDDVWVYIDGKLALDVGGDHGKASGLLEFGADTNGNNYTSYVSDIKASNNTVYDSVEDKTVTYLGNKITFKYKSKETTTLKPGTHTLTMYYMERGMWESNMAVAFNFPDNNELQVQKIVDTTDVNDWFKSCFDTPDLFAFNIKNQATHYQNPKQDATIDSDVNLIKLNNSDYASCKPATENSKGNIFKLTTAPTGEEALHWYGQYQDTNPPSECRSERYGILTLRDAIDISQKRYLTFDIYAKSESGQGVLSLGNLYLELLDKNGKQKGCLDKTCLNGTTYGTVTLANDKWITVKLDLYKLNAEDDFDPKQVTTIRVGDNYPRHIYFRNFVFSAQAKATTKTGFTTKQEDIPVYGSIDAKGLKNAAGAQFTTTKNNDTQVVDKNGQFMLQNGETVTFSDQFRRGSYISLKETLSPNLYDTTWTVFENDEAVQSYGSGETVNNGGTQDLNGQAATESQPGPDDGRTEVYNPAPDIANNGYTANQKPENANTIVFRSYKDPDENTSSLTKLKVQFVNKVKTGKLVIKKAAASDEVNLIKGKYTFNVTFTNVGDESLEQKPIKKQVTINMKTEDHCEISGIPIGTRFRIEEVKPSDGSHLQGVSVIGGGADTQVVGNTYVQGSISETDVTATFTNTMHELINIDFTKTWVNANGDPLEDGLPKEIYVQLQRRKTKNDPWQPVGYPDANTEYVTVRPIRNGWNCAFANLDKFDVNDSTKTNYEYRIVEGTVDDNDSFTEVKPNETIPIKGNTYGVTAEAKAEISEGNSTKVTNATVNGGTITGDSGTIVLTNTLQNPKFVLNIIKKDAEKGENNKEVFLKDVEFKLEKLKAETTTTEGEPQWVVDTTYKFDNENTGSITATTKGDGKITDVFKNLEPGTYRLTETKAHPGYNLLAQPIVIKFTQGGECYIDGEKITDTKTFVKSGNTYTMNLTVLNRKTPELPHTGADAPSLWLLIGMPLAVAGLLIFTFRYNRKGGRRH